MASASPSAGGRTIHVIGFGSVGQAMYKTLAVVIARGQLHGIKAIKYRAPEITEASADGLFSFAPGPVVTRETLVPLLDDMKLEAGDIIMELACRIDTRTIWLESKKRGCHFLNSGFDVWSDVGEFRAAPRERVRVRVCERARTCVSAHGRWKPAPWRSTTPAWSHLNRSPVFLRD